MVISTRFFHFAATLLLPIIGALPSWANDPAVAVSCPQNALQSFVPELPRLEPDSDTVRTVFEVSSRPGRFGMQRIYQRKDGRYWRSSYAYRLHAKQGDPRAFIIGAGIDVGHFFGFDLLPNRSIALPDADELNGAIQLFNAHVDEANRIPIRFKKTPVEGTAKEYLWDWATDLTLGYNTSEEGLLHDASYHAGSLLLPPSIVNHFGHRAKLVRTLHDTMHSRFGSVDNLFQAWLDDVILEESKALDFFTGNAGYFLAKRSYNELIHYFQRLGKTPAEAVRSRTHGQKADLEEFLGSMSHRPEWFVQFDTQDFGIRILRRLEFIRSKVREIQAASGS